MENEAVINQMAAVKGDVQRETDAALTALIALVWPFRSPDFRWEDHPGLEDKANEILRGLSDAINADMKMRAASAISEMALEEYEDDAIEYAGSEIDGQNALYRLDMQSSHLKDLFALWIALFAASKITSTMARLSFYSFMDSPAAGSLKWGKGYAVNVRTGFTLIAQDFINRAFQYAKVQEFKKNGAIGYRTVRNSNFDCPFCDEMREQIWPLNVIVLPYHPRCVCYAVPVYKAT